MPLIPLLTLVPVLNWSIFDALIVNVILDQTVISLYNVTFEINMFDNEGTHLSDLRPLKAKQTRYKEKKGLI